MAVNTIVINRGPAGPPGPAGSGDIVAGDDTIEVVDVGDDVEISADVDAIRVAMFEGLAGIVRVAAGVLSASGLTAVEIETALGLSTDGFVRAVGGVLSSSALTKAEVETPMALAEGFVRADAGGVCSGSPLVPADLGGTATTGYVLTRTGAGAMDWREASGGGITPDVDVSAAGVVTGLSSGTVIPVTTGFSYGATPASAGAQRLTHNSVWAVGRNSADSGDHNLITWGSTANTLSLGSAAVNGAVTLVANAGSFALQTTSSTTSVATNHTWNIGGVAKLQVSATAVTLGTTTVAACNLAWNTGASSPSISQSAKTTDVAPQSLTIAPQAPFATATGANRVPGSCAVTIGTPTNAGTTHGTFSVSVAGSAVLTVDKDTAGVGRIAIACSTTTTAPSAGGAGALPATPLGYLTLSVNGTARQVPYY